MRRPTRPGSAGRLLAAVVAWSRWSWSPWAGFFLVAGGLDRPPVVTMVMAPSAGGAECPPGNVQAKRVGMRFRFEQCDLDQDRREPQVDRSPVHVEPQVFDVLAHLATHRDRLVTKVELLDEVWGDRFVSASALTSRIKVARSAIGDDGTRQRLIRTHRGHGDRFIGAVEVIEGPDHRDPPRSGSTLPASRARLVGRDEDSRQSWCSRSSNGS